MTAKAKKQSESGTMGRPPLPDEKKRTERITIVLRKDEVETISKKAQAAGMTVSDWGRETLLKAAGKWSEK